MAYRKPYKENVVVQYVVKFLVELILVISFAYLGIMNTCERALVVGNSMNTLLYDGQTVLINKLAYLYDSPKRYDVILFRPEGIHTGRTYIKRIIGLPGERVQIVAGRVLIDGNALSDDVNDEVILSAGLAGGEILLGEGEYFVLGDERNNSEDSRFSAIGNISEENIIGRPWLICSPMNSLAFLSRNQRGPVLEEAE